MNVCITRALNVLLFAAVAVTAVVVTSEVASAKQAGGGNKPGFAKPALAHPAKPNLNPALVKPAKPNLGGTASRTKAPGSLHPSLAPINPNLIGSNLKPIKLPGIGSGGTMPTFPPINPGGGFPTTPPFNPGSGGGSGGGSGIPTTPPINPSGPPVVVTPRPWHPCHPNVWFGVRVGLIGWSRPCYVPPVCSVPCVTTVNVAGDTIVVQDNAALLASAQQLDAAVVAELPRVVVATTVTLSGDNLGVDAGQVLLEINGLALPCRVDLWDAAKATATLPSFGLGTETKGKMHVIRADGSVAKTLDVMVVPAVEAAK